jgi:hypothetical protein
MFFHLSKVLSGEPGLKEITGIRVMTGIEIRLGEIKLRMGEFHVREIER